MESSPSSNITVTNMCHYCPECMDVKNEIEIESYRCSTCTETYCVHFMKWTRPSVCWICGSDKLKLKFENLKDRWKDATGFMSRMKDISSNPCYKEIIAMGRPALRFIFEDMEQNGPDHWFVALDEIIGDSPEIPEDDRGRMQRMTDIWIDWAIKNGHYERKTR